MHRDVPDYFFEEGVPAKHRHLVYIFAFNEGSRLVRQLSRFPKPQERPYDLILGDDGSTDGSTPSSLIKEFGLRGITRLKKNMGLSPAIKAGMDWYLGQPYNGVILMNGNDKDGIEAVPDFIRALEDGCGYVQGSRFLGTHENTPPYRHLAIRLVHAPLFSLAAGFWMTDTTNGFRAFSTESLKAMGDPLFSPLFQKYEAEQYMAWKAIRLGFRALEIPVRRNYPASVGTHSKIRPGIGWWHMIRPLLCLLLRRYQ